MNIRLNDFSMLAGLNLETNDYDPDKASAAKKERDKKEEEKNKKNIDDLMKKERSSQRDRKDNNRGNKRGSDFTAYAPYNFIPFPEIILDGEEISHDSVASELLSGEVSYKIEAKTPIFIGNGNKQEHFYKNSYGEYAIPGSSIRGMIRSNAQILGMSDVDDDIDNYKLMFREVANGVDKKYYNEILGTKPIPIEGHNISVLTNVEAGILKNEDGNYVIYPVEKDSSFKDLEKMNYYPISEKTIISAIQESKKDNKPSKFDYFKKNPYLLQHKINNIFYEYQEYEMVNNERIIKNHYVSMPDEKLFNEGVAEINKLIETFKEKDFKSYKIELNRIKKIFENKKHKIKDYLNEVYHPFYRLVSFESKGRLVTSVGKTGEYSRKGYLVSSGAMQEKKIMYIIPIDHVKTVKISVKDKVIREFEIDFNRRKNQLIGSSKNPDAPDYKEKKAYYSLPESGIERPVFYIQSGDDVEYIGFTPRLRIFYNHEIKDGFPKSKKTGNKDLCKILFGYTDTDNNKAYKSRVSFTDATIIKDAGECPEAGVVLGEPKPSAYLNYVENGKTYNNDFNLRGIKQYWLSDCSKNWTLRENPNKSNNNNIGSTIRALNTGSVFEGTIRFHNLTENELGLILWSIKLENNCWMNIGKAKSYGFGTIQIKDIQLRCFEKTKGYDLNDFDLNPFANKDADDYINKYKKFLNGKLKTTWDNNPSIKALLSMKNSTKIPSNEKVSYMSLEEFRKQKNNKATLPKIDDIIS
ncbi:TIGR03986 family type III CRISPR-associated RAMP protein [Oribacterium sp. FC2011]|uniref:TIGR03986 family type III CRISPR-associated RAMP protein n=1 Tax=Oribacterium sp. FC2011 TaxID=1408311 RepID=UPI0004E0DF0C|nr:TIGR03986 family CRISPR-associated RAMP protein [Oribacterium sp. FC2011]